jgi:3-hydroxyisobutyrate dehydrogenase
MKPRLGFVGLGRMGANMARRLRDLDHPLTAVYDRDPGLTRSFAAEVGAAPAGRLADVTAAAEIIFTVVTDDAAQLSVFAEDGAPDSLLAGARGRIFINCATLSPSTHVEVDRRARNVGAEVLEACMASSIPQARNGSLYLMCGGEPQLFESLRPLLTGLSSQLRYVGATGRAAQVKALVNMVMNINTAGLAEGLGLGAALGLDVTLLREVFAQTGAASQVLKTDGEDMQNRDHACFFSAAHAAKDSGIAHRLAVEAGLALPLAQATKEQYDRMVQAGLGDLDKSGIAELTFPGRRG